MTRQPGASARAARADAREQPAAAAGDEQEVERPDIFEQLARRGALAGDDVRMVEGRDERQSALVGEPAADGFAVVALAVVERRSRRRIRASRRVSRRRVGRHDDDARDVEQLARERDRLRVIAGEKATTPRARWSGGQPRQRVVGAAELEGAGALQVFALEEDVRAGARVQRARGDDRRAVRDAGDLPGGAFDVGVGGESANWIRHGVEDLCYHRGSSRVTRGGAVR